MSNLTSNQKGLIFESMLSTDEGRQALAEAMVAPIRQAMQFQGIARRILPPNPLGPFFTEEQDYFCDEVAKERIKWNNELPEMSNEINKHFDKLLDELLGPWA